MPKPHVSRLSEKYPGPMKGKNYRELMSEIIATNHESVQNAIARIKRDEMGRALARTKKTSIIAMPDIREVLPQRSVFIRKGATNGRILSDTLRDRLTADLRKSLGDYLKTGAGSMQYKKGENRGQIKPELITKFRASLEETFSGYRRAGPNGIPGNIQIIADTEIRSAISDMKETWARRFEESNPGKVRVLKTWKARPALSKKPRHGHTAINGQRKPLGSPFMVRSDAKHRGGAVDLMQHPHDPDAPPDQVIGCHCECVYETLIL